MSLFTEFIEDSSWMFPPDDELAFLEEHECIYEPELPDGFFERDVYASALRAQCSAIYEKLLAIENCAPDLELRVLWAEIEDAMQVFLQMGIFSNMHQPGTQSSFISKIGNVCFETISRKAYNAVFYRSPIKVAEFYTGKVMQALSEIQTELNIFMANPQDTTFSVIDSVGFVRFQLWAEKFGIAVATRSENDVDEA